MVGQSRLFNAEVLGGTPPFTYQWYVNGSAIPSSNSSTWTFAPTQAGYYNVHVIVTDANLFTCQSNIVNDILVYPQLVVTVSPALIPECLIVGQSQLFTSSVSGGVAPYSYAWYVNGTQISGATSSTYTFSPSSSGNYSIYLVVTCDPGSVQSNIVAVQFNPALAVYITPTQLKMYLGESRTFNASASGGVEP